MGGAMPMFHPTGWAYLATGCTIRWQRGDRQAYVFKGNQVGSWATDGLLGKIPVSPVGWVDLAHVRRTGENWVRPK